MRTHAPTSITERLQRRLAVMAVLAVPMALTLPASANTQDPPFNRGITDACVEQAMEADAFADVHLGQVHADAVDCLWVYGVVQGRVVDGAFIYDPDAEVTRQQMATFIARMLLQLPERYVDLPDSDEQARFDDAASISDAHLHNVNRLAEMGIVQGYDDNTYRPDEHVNRAQMASFIARAIEAVLDDTLPRAEGLFDDTAGDVHEASIDKLATAGIVQGSNASYHPAEPTTRAQMASFLARAMDHLVNAGVLIPMTFAQGTASSYELTEVDVGSHDGYERVVFTLANDEGTAGWRIRYVDAALQEGSGHEIDVRGDAVIEVVLTGTAPPDTSIDFDTTFDGEAVVEVVDGGWFEGRHQLFIGTTGLHTIEALQLDDPRRVVLDVLLD